MISWKSWLVRPHVSMGGGQIRQNDVTLDDVRQVYQTLPQLDQPLELKTDEIPLFTEYRPIEKNLMNAFNLKW